MKENIFLACPTHNGQMDHRAVNAMICDATKDYSKVLTKVRTSSLLANGCNNLYCDALNDRERLNLKWFAMIHADIVPESGWLDLLVNIADTKGYDMVAAHSPIKSDDGLTSTAVLIGDRLRRLTNHEIKHFPDPEIDIENINEFGLVEGGHVSNLLLNTGCMIVRIDQPWSHRVFFSITDSIAEKNGKFVANVFSEDWHFTRMVQQYGGKVAATRRVKLSHLGTKQYSIDTPGKYLMDPEYKN